MTPLLVGAAFKQSSTTTTCTTPFLYSHNTRPLLLAPVRTLTRPPITRRFIGMLAMHHIYCTNKIGFIEGRAKEMGLVGVRLYGKPGRVVVEGNTEAEVRKYLGDVRKLRWSKCVEMGVFPSEEVLDEQRLVDEFDFIEHDLETVRNNRALSPAVSTPGVLMSNKDEELENTTSKKDRHSKKARRRRGGVHGNEREGGGAAAAALSSPPSFESSVVVPGEEEEDFYVQHRNRPSVYVFDPPPHQQQQEEEYNNRTSTTTNCTPPPFSSSDALLIEARSEEDLKDILVIRGAGSLWRHINAPFSGMRPTNYSKTEVFAK